MDKNELIDAVFGLADPERWGKKPSRASCAAMMAYLAFVAWGMKTGWVPLLDSCTLIIHEAGHPILGMLSERLMVYGGSLFQLLFPACFLVPFYKQGEPLGFIFAASWVGASFHNLGIYIADARSMELPLVGNGDRIHDWNFILDSWGRLHWDGPLSGLAFLLAWSLWIVSMAAVARFFFAAESSSS